MKRWLFGFLLLALATLLCATALSEAEYVEVSGNGITYHGQRVDGQYEGFGIYYDRDGTVYYGGFSGGKLYGVGVNVYAADHPDGAIHRSGPYVKSKSNGPTVVLWSSGSRYVSYYEDGEIVAGQRTHTQNTHEWTNLNLPGGVRYMGEVRVGESTPNGYGVAFEPDGGMYAGEFLDGVREGEGIYMDRYHNSVYATWKGGLVERLGRTVYVDETHPLDWLFPVEEEARTALAATQSVEDVISKAVDSVFFVRIYDIYHGRLGSGSGFVTLDGMHFVTNHHVIEDAAYLVATSDSGESYTLDTLLYASPENDLAVLGFPQGTADPLPYDAQSELKRGQQVIAIGSPIGIKNVVSLGNISAFVQTGSIDMTTVQFTAPTTHGSSGGALLNMEGEVIGIIFGGLDDGENMNWAVPARALELLCRAENYNPQSLSAYNGLGSVPAKVENFGALLHEGYTTLGWEPVASAAQYQVYCDSAVDGSIGLLASVDATPGESYYVQHFESAAYPDYLYTYIILAVDAADQVIGTATAYMSLSDL